LALLVLPACSGEFTQADLAGFYVAAYQSDTATLSLRSDHTYTHTIRRDVGQILKSEGEWTSSVTKSKRIVIEFPDFQVVPSFESRNPRVANGSWTIELDRTYSWKIEICFDSDVGYCYVKQSNS
jgi:hypothetical protein